MRASVIFSLFIILVSCREPFGFNSISYEPTLVVEGMITNELKSHVVKLSYSTSIDTVTNLPETGADVRIIDGDNQEFVFTESAINNGTYRSPVFAGESGQSYTLHIQTASGVKYRSTEITQKRSAGISGLTASFTTNDSNIEGIEIYLNTLPAGPGVSNNYRWEWIETFERRVPFPSELLWTDRNNTIDRLEQVESCWQTEESNGIFIKTAEGLESNRVTNHAIHFIPNGSVKMGIRYSILLRQFSLDTHGFSYWRTLQEFLSRQGSLADIQTGNLPGNIRREDGQLALGYFDASDVTEHRFFIDPEDFVSRGLKTPTTLLFCMIEEIPVDSLGIFMSRNQLTHVIHKPVEGDSTDPDRVTGWAMVRNICGDCRELGITNEKPEFWQ